jgi:hypothetical protein
MLYPNYETLNRKRSVILLPTLLLISSIVSAATNTESPNATSPSPNLTPQDVVKIVVNALANNDNPHPDAGIEITFNFASPANKSNTGPLARFSSMVKSPVFGVMLNHKKSEFSKVVRGEGTAIQIVKITTQSNIEVHFAFRLGLQVGGEFKGMWMTEAVWPVEKKVEGLNV